MRVDGLSLTAAAALEGTTAPTVLKWVGAAVDRDGWRYGAKPADRLYRRMKVQTDEGWVAVDVRGSRAASGVAAHHNAVHTYLSTGDTSALAPFVGKSVGGVAFVTDPQLIEAQYWRGQLAVDDIYAKH